MGLWPRTLVGGTTISAGVIASAQGLFDAASLIALLVLLSFLLSRMLFGSPLLAGVRVNPDALDPEFDSVLCILEFTLEVSICNSGCGDLPLPARFISSSTQPAGVGGTGPKFDMGPGLLVGGDITRSFVRLILCDLG